MRLILPIATRRHAGLAFGLLLSSAAAGHASAAGYQVSLNSTPQAAGAGVATCSYNYGGGVGGSCNLQLNGVGSVSPVGGDGSATSASTSSYLQGQSTSGYYVDPSIHIQVNTASDLKTGTVQLYSEDTALNNGYQGYAGTTAFAGLGDTLYYAIAGADASTVTPITVSFTVDGVMGRTGTALDANSYGEMAGSFIFGPSTDQNSASFDLKNNATTNFATEAFLGGSDSSGWSTNAANTAYTYTETYDLQGASGAFPVNVSTNLFCGDGELCNYSAQIGISGPADFSYTSASGVFLTPTGAVPEPATWALMLAGFGGLGVAIRARRRLAAQALV